MTGSRPAGRRFSHKDQDVLWGFMPIAGLVVVLTLLLLVFAVGPYYTFTVLSIFSNDDPIVGPFGWVILCSLFYLFLLKINMNFLAEKSKKVTFLQCCFAGIIIWAGLSLLIGGPLAPNFGVEGGPWILVFLLGIVYGGALFFQHQVESSFFRRFGGKPILAVLRTLVGITLLYCAYFIYWFVAGLATRPYWPEEEGLIFLILIPLGIFLSVMIGLANSLSYWQISPFLNRRLGTFLRS